MTNLRGRNLLKETDLTREEFLYLVDFGARLREDKRARRERQYLTGRNIALIFEKASTRTMCAFEVGAYDQGAHVTYLGPTGSQIGHKESIKDTARVLGRMFDGIEYRGSAHANVEILGEYAGVPVWNGLTDEWHPTQMLADILTMRDHAGRPLDQVAYCYLGDARNNTANSLLVTGALLGMDVRVAAPEALWPSSDVQSIAHGLASRVGGPDHGHRGRRSSGPRGRTSSTPTFGCRWGNRPTSGTRASTSCSPTRSTGRSWQRLATRA